MKKILQRATFGFMVMALAAVLTAGAVRAQGVAQDQPSAYRFPAEFEPQKAVWVVWPNWQGIAKDDAYLPEAPVAVDMIKALTPHVKVDLVVESQAKKNKVQQILEENNVSFDNVEFNIIPYIDIGTRDWGPVYVINNSGDKKVVHFTFNYWGLEQYADPDEMAQANQFALTIAANQGLPVVEAGMVSEGGDREFNSKGTMITIKTTEMQRNPGMTVAQLEAKYKSLLGVKKVVWLDRGLATDGLSNDTIWPGPDGQKDAIAFGAGHMDEMARFVDDHTVLLALVTKEEAQKSVILAEDRKRLEKNYDILKSATDQSGKPFTIIRVPEAELVYYKLEKKDDIYDWFQGMEYLDGSTFPVAGPVYEVAATSYMNFIISNGVIVLPQYWEKGKPDIVKQKDAQAMAIMKSVFPGRQIVGVDPLAYNIGSGGGMHCSFQQEPATSH